MKEEVPVSLIDEGLYCKALDVPCPGCMGEERDDGCLSGEFVEAALLSAEFVRREPLVRLAVDDDAVERVGLCHP